MSQNSFGLEDPYIPGELGPATPVPELHTGESSAAFQNLDQAVTASTVAVAITDLTANLEADGVYAFKAWVPFALAGTASGYKFSLGMPTPVNVSYRERVTDGVTPALIKEFYRDAVAGISGALAVIGTHFFELDGLIENGGDAGALFLRFAQNTSDAAAITVKRGAYLEIKRIG